MSEYIRISAIQNKLKLSGDRVVYLYAAAGFGKTAAVEYFLRRKRHLIISGHPEMCHELPKVEDLDYDIIVVDDIQWITDEMSREYVRKLCHTVGKKVFLLGRGRLPVWLSKDDLELNFMQCSERDLIFGEKEVETLFANHGIPLDKTVLEKIVEKSTGYVVALKFLLRHLEDGEIYDERLHEIIQKEVFGYINQACMNEWDMELQRFLIPLCEYTSFTLEMAEVLTRENEAGRIIEYAESVGSFLNRIDMDEWEIRPFMKQFLQWKYAINYSKEERRANYSAAASYYESRGQVEQALSFYEKAGDDYKLSQMLIKNSTKHPGTAHFFETRRFYLALSPDKIKKYPVLMSGMSMLYSLMLQVENSEYWYEELKKFSKNKYISKSEQREAKIRLAYLDIALPHRGSDGIIEILKNTAILMTEKQIKMPEFSVTSNMPSVMVGGKDFSKWSKIDKELAAVLKVPLEVILGKYGKGMMNIALAESGFEKATMSDYEVMTRLNTGILMADTGGKIEVSFAGTGVMIKLHLVRGQINVARKVLESFKKKAELNGAVQLLPNIEAMEVRMALLIGDKEAGEKWLANAPDEQEEFCVLYRYQYMTKIRVLIALERYDEAASLVEILNHYFELYDRYYLWMENQMLKAILFYRRGMEEWQAVLKGALLKCQEYHFVRVPSWFGAAIKPLMDRFDNDGSIDDKFLRNVREEVDKMIRFYPEYLYIDSEPPVKLTEKETQVLKMMCLGMTNEEICRECGITYNGLKYHNKNIYKKLGVNSRQEVERKAFLLGLN